VEPVAVAAGIGGMVREQTDRVPYFAALQLLKDADLLFLIGSDDPDYTASKVYPYLLTRKPLVAVVHEDSPIVPLLSANARVLVTFGHGSPEDAVVSLCEQLDTLLRDLPGEVTLSEEAALACSAKEMTRRQCALFDRVITDAA
jgi:thiamine pyrophosphate-dependent acetolactate synthase large subunit-like protein